MYMPLQSLLCKDISPPHDVDTPPPDTPDTQNEEINSIYASTLNLDVCSRKSESEQEEYYNALSSRWSGKYLVGFQEDLGAIVNFPNKWTPVAWQRDLYTKTFLQDKFLILHAYAGNANGKPGGDTPLLAEAADHSAWIRNMRWAIYQKLQFYGDRAKIVLCNNEPDNVGIGSGKSGSNAYDVLIEDLPASVRRTVDAKRLQRKRLIWQCKAVWEQMHGINQDADMQAPPHPGHFFGPSLAFPSRAVADSNQMWHMDELFSEENGEILSYLDGITVHNHRIHCRIELYDNTPPAANAFTLYNAWKAVETANALRTPGNRRRLPLMTDEAGINYNSSMGTWSGGTVIIPATSAVPAGTSHNLELRKYRAGREAQFERLSEQGEFFRDIISQTRGQIAATRVAQSSQGAAFFARGGRVGGGFSLPASSGPVEVKVILADPVLAALNPQIELEVNRLGKRTHSRGRAAGGRKAVI